MDYARSGSELAALFQGAFIKGVPTVVFLDRQGKERRDLRLVDFLPAEQVLVRMAEIGKEQASGK